MSWNGSGLFNIDSTGQPVSANTLIESADFNALTADLATGLSNCVTKDGQQTVTANLPMATYRHTGVGNASARTDYAAAGQVQDGKLNWVDGGGTADAITATYSPAITALVDGQLCCVRATAANATTTPTFAPSGLTARTIVKKGGAALVAGDIVADGHELILRYDLANTRWELMNPGAYAGTGANTFTGIQRWAKGADVASANALTLGTDGNYFDITGTTAITSIGTLGVGTVVKLHFDAALTLTNHATDLILPGGANITTAAGDEAEFVEYATGDWRCTNYTKASAAVTTSGITMSTARLLGRTTASTGAVEEITVGSGLSLSAGSLTATGSGITLGTPVASTSGTSIDFTSIPSGTKRVTINFNGVSTSGSSHYLVQVGDSGGIENTGYASGCATDGATRTTSTAGFIVTAATAAGSVHSGSIVLSLENSSNFKWVSAGHLTDTGSGLSLSSGGAKSLSAELDRVRITTVGGSDTFDAGEINITYE